MIDEIPNRLNDDLPVKVIISGAGLAGLFLALLLEKLGVPYHLFERASEIKPLGKKSTAMQPSGQEIA